MSWTLCEESGELDGWLRLLLSLFAYLTRKEKEGKEREKVKELKFERIER